MGRWRDASSTQLPANTTFGVGRFADIDGDGDLDLLVASNRPIRVYSNDGSGSFTDLSMTHGVGRDFWRITVFDCDGDGDPDFVGIDPHDRLGPTLVVNDGTGRFAERTRPIGGLQTSGFAVEAADLDGDRDLDLLVTLWSGDVRVLINDGAGLFADESARLGETQVGARVVRAADLDGDGDSDLVVGSWDAPLRMYRNRGDGWFQRDVAGVPPTLQYLLDIAFVDLDRHGDPDLVVASSATRMIPHRLYRNDSGILREPAIPAFAFTDTIPQEIRSADTDGDGDPDLILAGGSNLRRIDETQVFSNLHRHVDTAPNPRIGQALVLDGWHEAGHAQTPTPILPALGPDLLPRPVPLAGWGGIWLAPPTIATLPVAITSVPQGHTSWTLAVPPAQWLVGRSLHFQALALPGHVPWHLTNAVTVTFVR